LKVQSEQGGGALKKNKPLLTCLRSKKQKEGERVPNRARDAYELQRNLRTGRRLIVKKI